MIRVLERRDLIAIVRACHRTSSRSRSRETLTTTVTGALSSYAVSEALNAAGELHALFD